MDKTIIDENDEVVVNTEKLTAEQMNVVKMLMIAGQAFCDVIADIMKRSGIWSKGFRFEAKVNSDFSSLTEEVDLLRVNRLLGCTSSEYFTEYCGMSRGVETNGELEDEWNFTNSTTKEFTGLFDDETPGEGTEEGSTDESTVPSDSDPVCSDPDGNPVDGGQ